MIWTTPGPADHEQDGTSNPPREPYLWLGSCWNLAADDPVPLGTGRGNASSEALGQFLVFPLLIPEKKAAPAPSHQSPGGLRMFVQPLDPGASRLCSHHGSSGEGKGSVAPASLEHGLKAKQTFSMLSPGAGMLRLAPNPGHEFPALCLFGFRGGSSGDEGRRNFIFPGQTEAPVLCAGRSWCLHHKANSFQKAQNTKLGTNYGHFSTKLS